MILQIISMVIGSTRRPVESILTALIAVVNHRLGLAGKECHVQRRNNQIRGHLHPKGPAHHLAAEDIGDHSQNRNPYQVGT